MNSAFAAGQKLSGSAATGGAQLLTQRKLALLPDLDSAQADGSFVSLKNWQSGETRDRPCFAREPLATPS